MLAGLSQNEVRERLAGPMPRVADMCALILGMGKSGQAIADLLMREGARVIAYEGDAEKADSLRARWETRGAHIIRREPQSLDGIDFAVVSPGLPQDHLAVETVRQAGILITGEMELASRFIQRPLLAVTGTNGKTTVTRMIAHILNHEDVPTSEGGNIGKPLAEIAAHDRRHTHDPIAVEVSSYQCETFEEFHPVVAAITNLAPDHLDRYASVEDYYQTKFRIAINQASNEAIWLGPGVEDHCPAWVPSRRKSFALNQVGSEGLFYHEGALIHRDGTSEERAAWPHMAAREETMQLNALAAMGVVMSIGVPMRAAAEALERFEALPHRLEFVADVRGIRCIDDSKATNIHAVAAALRSLPGPIRLIAGGIAKQEPLEPLTPLLQEKVVAAYLIGQDAQVFEEAWSPWIAVHREESLEAAVHHALEEGQPGDTLLLSPACASWDMFTDYIERGQCFQTAVREAAS